MPSTRGGGSPLSRRGLLLGGLAVATTGTVAACAGPTGTSTAERSPATPLSPTPGQHVVQATLTPRATTVDLGGLSVETWAYDDAVPGPLIRATAGDLVRVRVDNQLPAETTVHWHGVRLRNAADGVPGLTQDPIASRASYTYEFTVPDPGTYFFHPHVGVQLDRGLYAPLIVDDPDEPGDYDLEWVVVLDDWLDGLGQTPDDVLGDLRAGPGTAHGSGHGMSGMNGDSSGGPPFGSGGDVDHRHFLVNGRLPTAPQTWRGKPGQRARIRIINAGSDTIFAVALGGHPMTVTHTDGFPVVPREVGALYLGMGERYDVVVTLGDGVFPFVARPFGKPGQALAVVRTSAGIAPSAEARPAELDGPILLGADLEPAEQAILPDREVDSTLEVGLVGGMARYVWGINDGPYGENTPLSISEGQRTQLRVRNQTMMTHPVHVHGHTFALPTGLRKDTVLVPPMASVGLDLDADNPGRWMVHCHNIYHAEAGMMISMDYA